MTTRDASSKQEKTIANMLGGTVSPNSGAGKWRKGDVVVSSASMLVECKTCMTDKSSFSIKEEWFLKNKNEAFSNRLDNHCVAVNFGPDKPNYFIIDGKLMRFLIEKLSEENSD